MAAAAAEFATVFLETTLGTRLVVSFPTSVTTVASLKRQVSAEHAACFPGAGPIAVKSLQVKHDGCLFHLADSMPVEGAFRWVKGPWHLLVEAHELRPHPLARDDVGRGSCDESERNAGSPVVRNSTQNNMSSPAVPEGDGHLAIGGGVPTLNEPHENHQGIECASDQLEDGNTVPRGSSDIYLASDGSDTPPMEQQDQSHKGVEHALGQHKDEIVKAMIQERSDLYLDADASGNPVGLQDKSCQGVKHALVQLEDGNVKTMLQQSSCLNLTAGESDPRAKKQLDKYNEDVEQALSRCKGGNVKATLHESSDLDVAAGDGETPSMNQPDKSYKGVKHALEQHKNGKVKAMLQENSDLGVAAGESETTPMNQLDKSYESVKHASDQPEDGNVKTMPEESSDFHVAASECETPPMNQLEKSREDIRYTSGQLDDGTVNVMLQTSSDLDDSAAAKGNGPMQGQQEDIIAKPRGTELFRKEARNDEIIVANCDDNISSLASSIVNINFAQEKSSGIEQENLNSNPLANNQGSCSHGMGKNPSLDQKEPWTSGESSNSGGSDIPPCVQSVDRDNSSNREINAHEGNNEEPWVAGLCSGESSFKETDVPHCIKSMTEGKKRLTSNDRFLKKRKSEGDASTISTELESCFITRKQRVLSVRKVPISKAAKIYGLRC